MVRTAVVVLGVLALTAGAQGAPAPAPAAPRDAGPWWSPQGTTIAFQRELPPATASDVLYTGAVAGKEADIIGPGRARGFRPGSGELLVEVGSSTSVRDSTDRQVGLVPGVDAAWSPDGSHVAFLQGDTLAVSAADGTDVHELARGIVPPAVDVSGPVWSPDGSSIAIATASAAGSAIDIVPLDGSKQRAVFDGAGENVDPSWSPDGATLAFDRDASGRWAIWIVGRDGSGAVEAIGGAANNRFPQWNPTDGRLAFISDRGGAYGLYVGAPGGAQQQVARNVAPGSPARWSPDGTALAVAGTDDCHRFGIDVVRSSGVVRRSNQCHIAGTVGADTIYGTPYYDRVDGLGGNDAIFAGNGDDVVYGGAGNDRIGGGPGNDVIDGGPGDDVLSGGTGNDVVYAGPGKDKVGCGPGNDTAYVGPGDTVRDCEHVHRSR